MLIQEVLLAMSEASIRRFFFELHIDVRHDWMENAMEYIKSKKAKEGQKVSTVNMMGWLFEQWLYSNISRSTVPKLRIPPNASKLSVVNKLPVQILSVKDISKPQYARKSTTNNAEFQSEIDPDAEEEKLKENQREMLLMELTDGQTKVKGLQYSRIPLLTKKLAPGTKALIIGKALYKHGCLLLTAENFQVLGGESPEKVETIASEDENSNCSKVRVDNVPKESLPKLKQLTITDCFKPMRVESDSSCVTEPEPEPLQIPATEAPKLEQLMDCGKPKGSVGGPKSALESLVIPALKKLSREKYAGADLGNIAHAFRQAELNCPGFCEQFYVELRAARE